MPGTSVYDGALPANMKAPGSEGRLFSGMKFWLSHSIPQRQWLLQNAQVNGAEIVPLEKQADMLFVDHMRKNQAPGTYSYRFIELSIKNGRLEDPDAHVVGVATRVHRTVGSTVVAPKKGRTFFTDAEDQWLYNLVKPYSDAGGEWKGNEIYKQLERLNGRHTYQSWRDRYIKYVVNQGRHITQNLDREQLIAELEAAAPASPIQQQSQQQGPMIAGPLRDSVNANKSVSSIPPLKSAPKEPGYERQRSRSPSKPLSQRPKTSPNHQTLPATTSQKPERPTILPPEPVQLARAAQNCTRSSHKESSSSRSQSQSSHPMVETPGSQRTAGVQRDPFVFTRPELGHFTAEEATQLYRATTAILACPAHERERAWDAFAEDWSESGHTVAEWKQFFDTVILPKYRSRRGNGSRGETATDSAERVKLQTEEPVNRVLQDLAAKDHQEEVTHTQESDTGSIPYAVTCSRCLTTQTRSWRYDKKGRTFCDDCGQLSQRMGVLRPSTALLERHSSENLRRGRSETFAQNLTDKFAEPMSVEQPSKTRSPPHAIDERQVMPLLVSPMPTIMSPGRKMVDRASSPIIPTAHLYLARQESPHYEPLSPTAARAPEPNEARKRTAGKTQSTSQESGKSLLANPGDENTVVHRLQTPPIRLGKRKRLSDDFQVIEIPPTPEHTDAGIDSFNLPAAQHSSPELPLRQPFFTQGSPALEDIVVSTNNEAEVEGQEDNDDDDFHQTAPTSPIMIDLVSDPIPNQLQTIDDDFSDVDAASVYNFETAAEISYEWETAPETPQEESLPDGEEPNEKAVHETDEHGGRSGTPLLFSSSDVVGLADDDVPLPPPDDGWQALGVRQGDIAHAVIESIEVGIDEASDRQDEIKRPVDAVSDDEIEREEGPSDADVDAWIAEQKSQWPKLPETHLESMLQAALQSTCLDFDVADQVFNEMVKVYRSGETKATVTEGGIVIPAHIAGCWTEEDDNLLFSKLRADVTKVHTKHGVDRCNERLSFLQEWEEE